MPTYVETLHYGSGGIDRLAAERPGNRGRRGRDIEDVTRVPVLNRFEMHKRSVGPTCADDRDLAVEVDERLEDRFAPAERPPGIGRIGFGKNRNLSLSVVAEGRRLEDRGPTDPFKRRHQLCIGPHGRERRHRQTEIGQKCLLAKPVLRDLERSAARPDDRFFCRRRGGRSRHVLEFEGHDVNAARKRADRVQIVVRGVDLDVSNLAGGRVVLWRQRMDPIAKPAGRHGEHASQLPAAEDADDGAGKNGRR